MREVRKPHKHAEVIKKWADGEKIQVSAGRGPWMHVDKPHWSLDQEYRVKPEIIKFRVALCQGSHDRYLMIQEECDENPESRSCGFIKWLTDWQEVEVNS